MTSKGAPLLPFSSHKVTPRRPARRPARRPGAEVELQGALPREELGGRRPRGLRSRGGGAASSDIRCGPKDSASHCGSAHPPQTAARLRRATIALGCTNRVGRFGGQGAAPPTQATPDRLGGAAKRRRRSKGQRRHCGGAPSPGRVGKPGQRRRVEGGAGRGLRSWASSSTTTDRQKALSRGLLPARALVSAGRDRRGALPRAHAARPPTWRGTRPTPPP
mmetsp:Transcript_3842/g.9070  ORF Transcript_3842/g.9070 Transcript_3842/m.9070 type:complete len:220 (+) Transcript_3842:1316-1975(+)